MSMKGFESEDQREPKLGHQIPEGLGFILRMESRVSGLYP